MSWDRIRALVQSSNLEMTRPAFRLFVIAAAIGCGSQTTPTVTTTTPSMTQPSGVETVVYSNDFNAPPGTTFPEWSAATYTWTANAAGTVAAGSGTEAVTNVDSANLSQRFLGELGGPVILTGPPYDAPHFVRVTEAIVLNLTNLPPHGSLAFSFDLDILKSWDGNNGIYGPDRWSVAIEGGATLLTTTFSNNFKTGSDLSLQDYPSSNSPPQTGATAANTLGYGFWFGDSTYHLSFNTPHTASSVKVVFSSSLNEGKSEQSRGTRDESWALDNVRVAVQ